MVLSDEGLQVIHFEHRLWVNELNFFADELNIYEQQLGALATKYDKRGAMQELEQFQNQFIRQKEVLDTLQHDIHIHEQKTQRSHSEKFGITTGSRLSQLSERTDGILPFYLC